MSSDRVFSAQLEYFSKRYEIYVPDWFGLCRDAMTPECNAFEQISALLVEHLNQQGIQQPTLIGHSLGGALALDMVGRLQYPANKLVIIDTSLTPSAEKKQAYHQACDHLLQDLTNRAELEAFWRRAMFADCDNAAQREWVLNDAMSRIDPLWFQALNTAVEADFMALLSPVEVPVLYVGRTGCDVDQQQLMQACPDLAFQTVQKSGHFVPVFAAQQLNQALDSFL